MKILRLSLTTLVLRFYLLMAIVITAGFAGQWLFAFLALPVFLSCLMGVQFKSPARVKTAVKLKSVESEDSPRILSAA